MLVLTAVTFADPQGPARRWCVLQMSMICITREGRSRGRTQQTLSAHRAPRGRNRGAQNKGERQGGDFKQEVGFGGSIVLTTAAAKAYEIVLESANP